MRVKLRSLQKSSSFNTDEEIEADPFGYILSPSLLSAGIRNDKSARSPSPFWIKASSTSKSSSFSSSDRRLVKVKRWILRIESWYLRRGGGRRQQHHQDHQTPNPVKSSIVKAADDAGARSTSTTTGKVRGRSDTRTSSANREDQRMTTTPARQHLWRKPSESLWPVLEEPEDLTP